MHVGCREVSISESDDSVSERMGRNDILVSNCTAWYAKNVAATQRTESGVGLESPSTARPFQVNGIWSALQTNSCKWDIMHSDSDCLVFWATKQAWEAPRLMVPVRGRPRIAPSFHYLHCLKGLLCMSVSACKHVTRGVAVSRRPIIISS